MSLSVYIHYYRTNLIFLWNFKLDNLLEFNAFVFFGEKEIEHHNMVFGKNGMCQMVIIGDHHGHFEFVLFKLVC